MKGLNLFLYIQTSVSLSLSIFQSLFSPCLPISPTLFTNSVSHILLFCLSSSLYQSLRKQSLNLSNNLSISVNLFFSLTISPFLYQSLHLSVNLSFSPPISLFLYQSLFLSINLSFSLSISPFLNQSLVLSTNLSFSLSISSSLY